MFDSTFASNAAEDGSGLLLAEEDTAHNTVVLNNCSTVNSNGAVVSRRLSTKTSKQDYNLGENTFLVFDKRSHFTAEPNSSTSVATLAACDVSADVNWAYKSKTAVCICTAGRYITQLDVTIWKDGAYSPPTDLQCEDCPVGYYQPRPNEQACSMCEAGYFQPSPGSAKCGACSIGRYQSDEGDTKCIGCAPGTISVHEGDSFCQLMKPGHFMSDDELHQFVCPAGKFSPSGTPGCTMCPAGTVCEPGVETPAKCPSGKYAFANECMGCPTLGNDNKWADCKDGLLTFKNQFWHDGLDLASASVVSSENSTRRLSSTIHFTVQPLQHAGPYAHSTTIFYRCPDGANCFVDPVNGAVTCGDGQKGVLCALCTDEYFEAASGKCEKCDDRSADASGVALFVAVYFGLPLLCTIIIYSAYISSEILRILTERVMISAFSKVKILAGFYTVVVLFEDVYTLPYPEVYRKFVNYFKIFDFFPALRMLKLACTIEYNFHTMLYFSSTVMVILMVLVLTNHLCFVFFKRKALPSNAVSVILFAITMLYPSSSTIAFRAFNCRSIDGVEYHREDLSIECASSAHKDAEAFAVVSMIFVSVGLLVLYTALLWPHHTALQTGMRSSDAATELRSISFLYNDFTGPCYYWEIIDAARKLMVCGFVVFLEESLIRPVVGMLLCFLYIVVLVQVKPYKEAMHNYMAIVANVMLFFSLVGGILSKIEAGFVSTGEDTLGFSEETLGVMLIICFLVILVMGVVFMVIDVRTIRKLPLLKDSSGHAVVLKKVLEGCYHLFLSHTWASGQNQMQALKKELQLLVPSMKLFLDVENLTNIGALEQLIESSDSVLVFLSTGYFKRWNCLREVNEAIVQKKDIILLRESAEMHGGGHMQLVMDEIETQKKLFTEFAVSAKGRKENSIDIKAGVFGDDPQVLLWHRVLELKRVTLKMICQRVLQQQGRESDLTIPGELTPDQVQLPPLEAGQDYHVCLPQATGRADGFVNEFTPVLAQLDGQATDLGRRPSFSGRPSMRKENMSGSLKIGICGQHDCTLQNSSNMLFLLGVDVFSNEPLLQELRQALVQGVNVVTVHLKEEGEEFDSFIGACPTDLKTGNIVYKGQEFVCPSLFEGLAVDWYSSSAEYQPVCAMLIMKQLRQKGLAPGGSNSPPPEAAKNVPLQDLEGELNKRGVDEMEPKGQELLVVDVADI
jgi:hypothetical protein